jgi:hypothetical protein
MHLAVCELAGILDAFQDGPAAIFINQPVPGAQKSMHIAETR